MEIPTHWPDVGHGIRGSIKGLRQRVGGLDKLTPVLHAKGAYSAGYEVGKEAISDPEGFLDSINAKRPAQVGGFGPSAIIGIVFFVVTLIIIGALAPQMYSGLNDTKSAASNYGDAASSGIIMLIAFFFFIGLVVAVLRMTMGG